MYSALGATNSFPCLGADRSSSKASMALCGLESIKPSRALNSLANQGHWPCSGAAGSVCPPLGASLAGVCSFWCSHQPLSGGTWSHPQSWWGHDLALLPGHEQSRLRGHKTPRVRAWNRQAYTLPSSLVDHTTNLVLQISKATGWDYYLGSAGRNLVCQDSGAGCWESLSPSPSQIPSG